MCAGCIKEDKATEELLGEEGWMHGGDTGALDAEGYLRMTGRKMDLIVLLGPEHGPPRRRDLSVQPPLISQAVVVGEARFILPH